MVCKIISWQFQRVNHLEKSACSRPPSMGDCKVMGWIGSLLSKRNGCAKHVAKNTPVVWQHNRDLSSAWFGTVIPSPLINALGLFLHHLLWNNGALSSTCAKLIWLPACPPCLKIQRDHFRMSQCLRQMLSPSTVIIQTTPVAINITGQKYHQQETVILRLQLFPVHLARPALILTPERTLKVK